MEIKMHTNKQKQQQFFVITRISILLKISKMSLNYELDNNVHNISPAQRKPLGSICRGDVSQTASPQRPWNTSQLESGSSPLVSVRTWNTFSYTRF